MALTFKTRDDVCRVYNDRGAEAAPAITQAGTVLTVTGAKVNITNRGWCWPISAPRAGYVMEGEVVISGTVDPKPDPDPEPEPTPQPEHVVEVFVDGKLEFRKELF